MIQEKKKLSECSTFGIGGPADYFAEVTTPEEMSEALSFCQKGGLRFMVVGKGSNCLFDDKGYKGMVILNKISFLERIEQTRIRVGSGYSFSLLGSQTARWGLSGLEFASGIPGTVGGAVAMNAGANGKETCETLRSVNFMSPDGKTKIFEQSDMIFAYRTSIFQKMKGAIISAEFILEESGEARKKQIGIIGRRKETQPLTEKSAGCVFRNPDKSHSGALIEECGLKGKRIGGAMVSPLHANFIVNTGCATAKDVLTLITLIQNQVEEKTGRRLDMELRYIPYE